MSGKATHEVLGDATCMVMCSGFTLLSGLEALNCSV